MWPLAPSTNDFSLLPNKSNGAVGRAPGHDVVLARGEHEDRQLHLAQVHRHAAVHQRAGLAQPVLEVGVAQVVAVHRPGQVGAVGVPVEQVERRRLAAEQIVVDHVGPDQVVRAQAREHEREVAPGQDAAARRWSLRASPRSARRRTGRSARSPRNRASRRGRWRSRPDLSFFAVRTASAAPSSVPPTQKPSALTWSLLVISLRDAQRLEHALLEVVVPAVLALLGLDVAPGDHEHGIALGHGVGDEGVLRLQVEDVVLVDARRDHHQRTARHLGGGRLVLDELDQLVLVHDIARRHRQVATDLERRLLGLADALLLHVAEQIGEPARQALALGVERLAQRLGIGGGEIRRAHRIDPLARGEARARLGLRLELGGLDQLVEIARGQQVGLLQIVVIRVVAPFLRREAPVAGLGRGERLALAGRERRPKARLLLEVAALQRRIAPRAGRNAAPAEAGALAKTRIQPCVTSLLDCAIAASRASGEPGCIAGRFCDAQPGPSNDS